MKSRVATWIGAKLERRIACWSVCLSLALTLVGGAVSLAVFSSLLLDGIRGPLEHEAAMMRGQIEQGLAAFMGDAADLAAMPLVVTALASPGRGDPWLTSLLAGHKTGEEQGTWLTITDTGGRSLALNRPDYPRSYGGSPWLAEVVGQGRRVARLLPTGEGGAVLLAAYPVMAPDGRPVGALVGELALDGVVRQAAAQVPGAILVELRGDAGERLALAGGLDRGGDLVEIELPLRLPAAGSVMPSLHLRAAVDRYAPLAPLLGLLPLFAVVGLVLALAVLGLAALMGRRLAQPIRDLAEAAARVTGEASFDAIPMRALAGIHRGDEVGDLTRAFTSMLERLHHLYSGLEEQVDRRTEALRQAQAERAQVLAAMEDVICSFTPGLGQIFYVNPAIQRVTGMSPEDFVAQPDLLREIIDPADRDGWEAALAGLGPETPSAQAVFRVVGPDGGRRWLHGRYQLDIRGDDGQPVIDGIVSDITERRVAELAVASSEARLRAIFETVADSIITIDSFGFIEGSNPAASRLFGYEVDEMIGRNVTMLMPEPDRSAHDGYIRRYIDSGRGRVIGGGREVVAMRRNGEEFPAELAVSVLRLGDDKLGFVGVLRDITERKRVQDALRTAKEAAEAAGNAKAEFLAVMSHEIRTPLNGVLGTIGLLEDGELPAESRRYVDAARRSSEALLAILNDILDFSKMEAGRLDLTMAPLDIGRLAADVVEELGASAREKAVSLSVEVGPAVPARILADEGRVRQVLLNLLSNAVKFTHQGSVRVVVAAGAGKVRVEVIDSGIGIPEEAQQRLFNRFSQVDSSTSRRYGGTGLGLAIARRLVELMGGEIGVVSAPGAGSTFWFSVPGQPLPDEGEASAEPAGIERDGVGRQRMPARRRAGGRILLVEDSETNRLVATTILERAGYRVETAEDGGDAVAAVSEGRFDLVLMDVAMPEMDGFQATAAIRALPDAVSAAVPIVALTANALAGDRARCLAAGMDDYLPKPLPKAQLLGMVERFLGRPAMVSAATTARSPEAGPVSGTLRSLVEDIPAEALGHIIDTYIGDARIRLGRMAEAMTSRDLAALEREAHPVKSSSRTFGLEALGARAEQVEAACRAGDAARALALTHDLVAHSEAAFATLRTELAKLVQAPL